jgi:uncharacterized membrane protein
MSDPAYVFPGGHPFSAFLVPVPVVCFAGTLITDSVYAATAEMQWANMSAWMLTAGLVVAALAVVIGIIEVLAAPRTLRRGWLRAIGIALVLLLSIVNAFIHSRDAYTSVVPEGLALSAVVAVLMLATGLVSWRPLWRRGFGPRWEVRP